MIASSIYWTQQLEVPLVVLYSPREPQIIQALRTLEHWEYCFDISRLPFTLMEFKAGRRVVDARYPLKDDLKGLDVPDLMVRAVDKEWIVMADSAFGAFKGRKRCMIDNPLSAFVPSSRTLEYIKNFFKNAGPATYKGIHLRYAQTPAFAYSPLELFVKVLKDEEGPFLLVSDLVKARENFLKKFGRSDVVYPVWTRLAQNSAEDVWQSWVDMLLLSRCRPIYGCYFSSFDEMASYLGRTKLHKLHRGLA